jgi:hypothetical protein
MGVYNGSEWNEVTATPANVGVMGDVKAMHMANGTTLIYIGGTFTFLRGGMRVNCIATYDTVTKAWGQLSVNGAVGQQWSVRNCSNIRHGSVHWWGVSSYTVRLICWRSCHVEWDCVDSTAGWYQQRHHR